MDDDQRARIAEGVGFIAALDQSGGSTPKALRLYGIDEGRWSTEDEMFDLVHGMRTRIMTSPSFGGDRIIGAILFEGTMDRDVDGVGAAEYLWRRKQVVPFLKVDKGLAEEQRGVRLMKPIPGLATLLARAIDKGVFGTKMRSVVTLADEKGIADNLDQQFDLARQILDAGLVPIIEPEVDIHSPEKQQTEVLLKAGLTERLDSVPAGAQVMFKLTLPTVDGFFGDLVADPRVLRVVALSGGYSRDEACRLLARNPGVSASFSRALTEGLAESQSEEEFDRVLDASIAEIYAAAIT
ncbi:fructose bisphosphate aldolase [Blastococcus jejuensis]|uniref:fructose-bisphosphate aldolase n=1 Tax=Blastococcus jejuensis TaxID=351224 RepID=A0ABP6P6U1_9ACTN